MGLISRFHEVDQGTRGLKVRVLRRANDQQAFARRDGIENIGVGYQGDWLPGCEHGVRQCRGVVWSGGRRWDNRGSNADGRGKIVDAYLLKREHVGERVL